jgi:hypothetical protein
MCFTHAVKRRQVREREEADARDRAERRRDELIARLRGSESPSPPADPAAGGAAESEAPAPDPGDGAGETPEAEATSS